MHTKIHYYMHFRNMYKTSNILWYTVIKHQASLQNAIKRHVTVLQDIIALAAQYSKPQKK